MQQLARLIVLLAVLSVLWNVPYTAKMIATQRRIPVERFKREEVIKERLRLKKFKLIQDSAALWDLLAQMP